MVIFPHMEVVITVRDQRNMAALDAAMNERKFVVCAPISSSGRIAGNMGVLLHLKGKLPGRDGAATMRLKGLWRVRVEQVIGGEHYTRIRFSKVEEDVGSPGENPEAMRTVLGQVDEFVRLIPGIPTEIVELLRNAKTPGELADTCAYSPQFTFEERLELLSTLDPEARLTRISELFSRQLSAVRRSTRAKSISECDTCAELADQAIESEASQRAEHLSAFLTHVVNEHPGELLTLLAEKYGPAFMNRRALK
jgi:ATP-dependent Lon protease